MKFSRVLTGSIGVHTQPDIDFYAHLGVDLNFPTREKWVIRETGAVDLTLNKNGFSALVGGPIAADRNTHTVDIQNPFEIKLNLPGLGELAPLQGALTFIATPTKNGQPVSVTDSPNGVKANLQAAAKWKQAFSKKGDADLKVTTIHYEASGTIDLETYLGLEGAFSAAPTSSRTLGSFMLPNLPGPNAYFYGDAWARASVENAKIEASKGPFDASVTANLAGWLEGQDSLLLRRRDGGRQRVSGGRHHRRRQREALQDLDFARSARIRKSRWDCEPTASGSWIFRDRPAPSRPEPGGRAVRAPRGFGEKGERAGGSPTLAPEIRLAAGRRLRALSLEGNGAADESRDA